MITSPPMMAAIDAFAFESAARAVLTGLGHALLYGTLLALLTALVLRLFAKRIGHAVHVALWLIVLVKFVMPVAPASPVSLATLTTYLTAPLHNDSPAAAREADSPFGPMGVFFVGDKPAPRTAVAASPAVPWWTMIAGGYLAVVAIIAVARIVSFRRFVARCRRLPLVDDTTMALVGEACRRLGVARVPDVRLSEDAPAPFVLGTLSPMLILSRRHLVRPDEAEAVILHEVAHLRRGDLLVRYVQWIAGTLLFFWPVVAWVNRRIDLAREQACDEWALRHGRLSAGQYARCILRALHPAKPGAWLYRPAAMAANLSTIERRIDMILNTNGARSRRALRLPIVALLAAWAGFALSGAASADEPAGGKTGTATVQSTSGGTAEATFSSDGGETYTWQVSDADGQHMVIELVGEAVALDGAAKRIRIHGPGTAAAGEWHQGVFVRSDEEAEALAAFAEAHPNADVDGDGTVSSMERGAYLTAVAMTAPAAVLERYPFVDQNENGLLEGEEAAHLFGGTGIMIVQLMAETDGEVEAAEGDVLIDLKLDCNVADDADGEVTQHVIHGPHGDAAFGPAAQFTPPSQWLLENVVADVTYEDAAAYLEIVRAERERMHQVHQLHKHLQWTGEDGADQSFGPDDGQVKVEFRPASEE